MKKKLSVLLVARPDHSLQIYRSLDAQQSLSFRYVCFKVFPKWVTKVIKNKKITTVNRYAICSWALTFSHLVIHKIKLPFSVRLNESTQLGKICKRLFKKYDFSIIHYWPEHIHQEILSYCKTHNMCYSFADIHMPNPKVVYERMKEIYIQYGIEPTSTVLYKLAEEQSNLLEGATRALVPSSFVADSYHSEHPEVTFHIVPYGITVHPSYKKKHKTVIKDFVYAGRVSLEKGCDLLFQVFAKNPNIILHVFGGVSETNQLSIFDQYQSFPNIVFHGSVPKAELQTRIKDYDVGIHLSRFDAYSLAVGEIIGAGLPVIVSDQTGNKDDVINEGFGAIVSLDIVEVENTICKMLNPDIYNQYIDNIENYISKRYIPYGDRMISFYKSFINDYLE